MHCAERQVQLWGYTPPLPLDRLARDFHADIIDAVLPSLVQGYSWTQQGRLIIVVNTRQTPMSRRFTIVHELMHGWLHPRLKTGTLPLLQQEAVDHLIEVEANGAAAAFLLPAFWLEPRLTEWDAQHGTRRPWDRDTFGTWLRTTASTWAAEAQVSQEMLGYRLLDMDWLDDSARQFWRSPRVHQNA